MKLADVVGQERAVGRLRRVGAAGRVPGAVLLLGPRGIGKRTLAEAFATRLLCEAPVDDDACGVCRQCTRLAAATHPDLRVVTREEDRRDLRIEQVRELTRWLGLAPLMAARKVAIFDEAHCLNEHGQNALLKTLEEPPGDSILVLVSSSAALLLPTVRSRCQIVRLDPLPADAVARVLAARGVPEDDLGTLAALADGSPGCALEFAGPEAKRARTRLLEALPQLDRLAAHQLSAVAQEVSRGPAEAALAAAVAWYRDALHAALAGAAERPSARLLLRQLEAVCDTIAALEKNANRMLCLETMLLWLRAIEREASPA